MTNTLNIAHRGARSLAPENTLAAARKAIEVGADMWEFDVGVTADGELILMHDDSLSRTTNAEVVFPDRLPWNFTTFTLAEIKQLETGSAFLRNDPFEQIAAGVVTADEQAALQGEPVPTLREALTFTRDHSWRVNVEIKRVPAPMDSFPIVEEVVALIEELDMIEQVLVSSFIPLNLKKAKDLNPAIRVALLSRGPVSKLDRIQWLGLDPDGDISPWQYFSGNDPTPLLAELNDKTYHPFYPIINYEQIEALQKAGIAVNIWTVNDPNHMLQLVEAGVNGILTDYPQLLHPILAEAYT